MAYDESLAERVRARLAVLPHLTEREMFGGICGMYQGNTAPTMVGRLFGDPEGWAEDPHPARWVDEARIRVITLPPKGEKAPKRAASGDAPKAPRARNTPASAS